jgi:hypothetical protein
VSSSQKVRLSRTKSPLKKFASSRLLSCPMRSSARCVAFPMVVPRTLTDTTIACSPARVPAGGEGVTQAAVAVVGQRSRREARAAAAFSTEWHGGAASGAVAMFDSRQSSFDQLCVAMKAVQDFAPSIFFADGSHHALLMYLITAGRIIADCLAASFQRPAGAAAGGAAGGASPGASGSSEMSARTDLDLMSVQSETATEQHGAHLRWGFERLWTAQLPVMRILLVTALNGLDGMTRPEALLAVGAASRATCW